MAGRCVTRPHQEHDSSGSTASSSSTPPCNSTAEEQHDELRPRALTRACKPRVQGSVKARTAARRRAGSPDSGKGKYVAEVLEVRHQRVAVPGVCGRIV